jgi:hypothetical protein
LYLSDLVFGGTSDEINMLFYMCMREREREREREGEGGGFENVGASV